MSEELWTPVPALGGMETSPIVGRPHGCASSSPASLQAGLVPRAAPGKNRRRALSRAHFLLFLLKIIFKNLK